MRIPNWSLVRAGLAGGLLLAAAVAQEAKPAERGLTVTSPAGVLAAKVEVAEAVTCAVSWRGVEILRPSPLSLAVDERRLGRSPELNRTSQREVDQILHPVVRIKRAEIRDRFHEGRLDFAGGYALVVRAYDDGVAWRWVTALPGEIVVREEEAEFVFAGDHRLWFPEETSFISHQERLYLRPRLSEVGTRFASLPALVEIAGGPKVLITEADLLDYPGMNLTAGGAPHSLRGLFPAYPAKVEMFKDRTEQVVERADYLARTRGTREFPWRVLIVAGRDAALLETDIVYRLASETALADSSWVRPGKVAWDWWNANNLFGVSFRAGVNTATYKHYIDFAAENGVEYVILDEGWYPLGDLLAVVPGMDLDALAAYARERKVGLILWVVWKTLDLQMASALDRFEKWGVAGIKVDFMQREDQWMVNFYERVAREAARRHLLVDFHGAYKPTGLYRTYPNVLTSEGVVGLEHNKWSQDASPDNAVTFPFLRMVAGPVDYTPGAMMNAPKADFRPVFNRPMSQGTRCHQLAMYVVYESPLQMLADSPSNYRREAESLAFLSAVPTVWDETRALSAAVGEHLLVARRQGRTWYVGALTDWTARDLEVDLTFLGPGRFQAEIFSDGVNADRVAVDYRRERREVSAAERLAIHLAPGGGWVARIVPRD